MVEHDEGLTKTYNRFHDPAESNSKILRLRELHAAMDPAVLDAYGWNDVPTACGFALDWLELDDDELADTLASAPDDIRERIESAVYFFPDAAADSDSDAAPATRPKAKRAKKASKRASKKSKARPMFDE